MKNWMRKFTLFYFLILGFFLTTSLGQDCKESNPCFKKDKNHIRFPNNIFIVIDPGHGCNKKENTQYECGSGSSGARFEYTYNGKKYIIYEDCLTTELAL